MDDAGKQPPSFGGGGQRGQHSRPFFYVQPPSQPYHLYQHWQLNNPYSHYGLPGGFNFGRPCMQPYPYMPYPGFVLPHAPIYPMDYRRMFEPRFHAPAWGDMPRQQQQQQYSQQQQHSQQQHSQSHRRRETACSEAQTEPSDAITKLIECLDKIRATDLQGAERELDSGVASQSFSMFSPGEDKGREQGRAVPSVSSDSCLECTAVTLSDSTAPVDDSESSQMILEPLSPQGCWSGGLEEELPLDSSSVHEERPQLKRSASDEHFLLLEKEAVTDVQSNISVTDPSVPRGGAEELLKAAQSLSCLAGQSSPEEVEDGDAFSEAAHQEMSCADAGGDRSCQILKLPFDRVLTPAAADAAQLSSSSAPYYYNYLSMQTTHERTSVLGPSLDELSSRDEMFSTDLEDVDLFPKNVYAGRRLSGVLGGSPQADEDVEEEEVWLPDLKSFVCACCGKGLVKGSSRNKVNGSKVYWDDGGDSEEDGRYGRGCERPVRVVVRKHSAPRKAHALPLRHPAKHWSKRGQYKEGSDAAEQEGGRNVCKHESADGDPAALDGSELQCRTCEDRLCRDDLTTVDQMPRRRPATPLPRHETSAQWKLMYHRPRDETRDEPPPPSSSQWERDMEAATSTLHRPYSLGPRGPNPRFAGEQSHGPHQAAPAPPGPPRSEEQQQHHKPFFYIQSSQPYLPMQGLQWPVPVPMPVSYNPYYGYPGLGYGPPVMPHYQPNPYLEPPGFVVPHTHLHLMDYRRLLNPQYYQTMAYHARRFRYQHNSAAKEMTSSEVQTEPLAAVQRTSTPGPGCSRTASGNPTSGLLSPASTVEDAPPPELQDSAVASSSTARTPSTGGFVIQTEEVRIECCTTPAGMQLLHAHETAGMSRSFSRDLVHCSAVLQSRVVQDEGPQVVAAAADQPERVLRVCPDVLSVGTPSPGERSLSDSTTGASTLESKAEDLSTASKNFHLKCVRLPFDPKYLDELRKMESTVWSAEEMLISSPESFIQHGPKNTLGDAPAEATAPEMPTSEEIDAEEGVSVTEMSPLTEDELEDELEDMVPTVESLGDELASEADPGLLVDAPDSEDPRMCDLTRTEEVAFSPSLALLDGSSSSKAKHHQHRRDLNVPDHQDTSFESLPAYLPSTSWLSDFDHICYNGRMPPAPTKQDRPPGSCGLLDVPNRRRKLDLEYKEQAHVRRQKDRYKPKGKVDRLSLSDHECCLRRNVNENLFSPYASKADRLCSRCLAKRRCCASPGPAPDGRRSLKRKAAPFQQWNGAFPPTCEACKSHAKVRPVQGSHPDLRGPRRGRDTEGESSGNSSCRADVKSAAALERPPASRQHASRCPAGMYPGLREKNCACDDPRRRSAARDKPRLCLHGDNVRGTDENCAGPVPLQDKWRTLNPACLVQRWQTGAERSWRDVMPHTDNDNAKNDFRSQHLKKHKKSQLQGTRTKDTMLICT